MHPSKSEAFRRASKVLVVCGPTATGKTKLAIKLAEKFNGEIISADSRQIYKYFDVVTGKTDYHKQNIKIWGIDVAEPDEEFSAKLFADYAREKIEDITSRKKLPIIEGGTGFYIEAALKNFEHINIPQNKKLREKYGMLDAQELFSILMSLDPQEAIKINSSDRKNKRRLIRILEKKDFELRGYKLDESDKDELYDTLWIGLNYKTREKLYSQIDKRVEDRLGEKLEKEIKYLKANNFFEKAESTTPGYKYWQDKEKWKKAEHNYAKRQITWFNRYKNINWFDPLSENLLKRVEDTVSKWYL